jgi:hypothetical protein
LVNIYHGGIFMGYTIVKIGMILLLTSINQCLIPKIVNTWIQPTMVPFIQIPFKSRKTTIKPVLIEFQLFPRRTRRSRSRRSRAGRSRAPPGAETAREVSDTGRRYRALLERELMWCLPSGRKGKTMVNNG